MRYNPHMSPALRDAYRKARKEKADDWRNVRKFYGHAAARAAWSIEREASRQITRALMYGDGEPSSHPPIFIA